MDLTTLALLGGAGLTAGTINAIAGGGSLIAFPTLVSAGLSPVSANVSNSISLSAGFLGAAYGSRRELDADSRATLLRLLPTAAAGTALGCLLLLATPARTFELVVPFLVLAAGGVLALSDRLRGLVGHPANLSSRRRTITMHTTVGLGSIYGGYFGAALSIVLIAILALLLDERLTRINAMKNVISSVIGLVTVVAFGLFGPVDWLAVAALTPTTVLGGYLGARLARRVPAKVLRFGIVVYAEVIGVVLLIRALG